MVDAIPAGYPRVNPYLSVDDAAAAIDFYCSVLGATERMRMAGPDGKIGHAELAIGDSIVMLADPFPGQSLPTPGQLGGTSTMLMVYVEDVDATFARAIAAGATETHPLTTQFYGDRTGRFLDPWGHAWDVASHVEDVDEEEMARRSQEAMGG